MADSQLAQLDTCHDAEASDRSDFSAFLKRGAMGWAMESKQRLVGYGESKLLKFCRRLSIDLIAAFHYIKEAYKKDGERLFTEACSGRTRGTGFKLEEVRFRLGIKES